MSATSSAGLPHPYLRRSSGRAPAPGSGRASVPGSARGATARVRASDARPPYDEVPQGGGPGGPGGP
ncbi:LytR family transcriptional regulator, partial [Micromonospora sp. 15K316]